MGVSRFCQRLDVLLRRASDQDYRRIAELWPTVGCEPGAEARLFQIFIRLTSREVACGVGATAILERLPRAMADGIRHALAEHLGLSDNGSVSAPNETA